MLVSILLLFMVVTFIALLVSLYLMETKPMLSIPFIFIGLIFSVICTYGLWNVEFAILQSDNVFHMESVDYGQPYSYVFVFMFFVFMLFFIRAGQNMWTEALETKGEIDYSQADYSKNKSYFR